MRSYPHKPNEALLSESLTNAREDYESGRSGSGQAEANRSAIFFKRQGDTAMDLAALEYAFGAGWPVVRQWLDSALGAVQKATKYGFTLDPNLYMTYLGLAVLSSNSAFREYLEALQRGDFTDRTVKADEAFYLAAEGMRDLAKGDLEGALGASRAGLDRLESAEPNPGAKLALEAILQLEQAIARKDQAAFVAALNERAEKDRVSYSKAAARNFPSGLLDVVGLSLLKLGRDNGLHPGDGSVYLPTGVLES